MNIKMFRKFTLSAGHSKILLWHVEAAFHLTHKLSVPEKSSYWLWSVLGERSALQPTS